MSAYTQYPQGPGQVIPFGGAALETDRLLNIAQQLEAALVSGREQCRKLREDLSEAQSKHYASLQESHSREQQLRQTAENAIKQLEQIRSDARLRLETSAQREQELSQVAEKATKQLEQIRSEARLRLEAAAHREEQLRSEAAHLRKLHSQLQSQISELRTTIAQLQETDAKFRSELEAAAQREGQLRSEAAQLKKLQEQFQGRIAELQGNVAQFQQAAAKSRSEVELYKASWTQVLKMEREARAYIQTKKESEARIHALETRNTELLGEAKARIQELQKQLDQARKEAAGTREELARERRTSAEERANAACALRTAEEERARAAKAREAEEEVAALRKRIEELTASGSAQAGAPSSTEAPPIEIVVDDLNEEFSRISSIRSQLETERDALKTQLAQAVREMRDMRRTYPLKDLVANKEAELVRASRELKKLPKDAPAREKAETLVELLIEQRDQLRTILRDSEMAK